MNRCGALFDPFYWRPRREYCQCGNGGGYQARAVDRIREILAAEHAAVRRELESRIAEGHWSGSGENIDPHHVTNALRELVRLGELEFVTGATRGA